MQAGEVPNVNNLPAQQTTLVVGIHDHVKAIVLMDVPRRRKRAFEIPDLQGIAVSVVDQLFDRGGHSLILSTLSYFSTKRRCDVGRSRVGYRCQRCSCVRYGNALAADRFGGVLT